MRKMARRKNTKAAEPSPAEINKMFFDALADMAKENGLELETLAEIIRQGVEKAIKRDNPKCEYIRVEINPEENILEMGIMKQVVDDEPLDDYNEINIEEARVIDPTCHVGGMCLLKVSPATFGRVAVQNAKQQIKHELKNHERERLIEQFNDKLYECVTAKVERIEGRTGNAVLSFDKSEVYLVHQEQIPGEILTPGDMIKIYVVGIANPEKKPTLKISRTHKDLVKRLFEKEVPEIADGVVEIKGISRVAGSRSKLAVSSNDPNVDAIGACIGPRKSRISAVVDELGGEKIDTGRSPCGHPRTRKAGPIRNPSADPSGSGPKTGRTPPPAGARRLGSSGGWRSRRRRCSARTGATRDTPPACGVPPWSG